MQTPSRSWFVRFARCALLAAAFAAAAVQAAPIPNAARKVSITAREQPIAAFLQNLFAQVDVPADLSVNLTGTVNGTFTGAAETVLRDVARVYNLVTYYDGAVMHVVPAANLVRRTYAVNPSVSERMLRTVAELDLTDARNTLRRTSDGSMLAVGTQRFIDQVDELIRAGEQRVVQPAAPAVQSAGVADFRVFYLRYAWAQDTTMVIGGRQVVVPGVASILRSLVGVAPSAPLGGEVTLRPTQPSLKGQGLGGQGVRPREVSAEAARNAQVDALVAALARTAVAQEPPQQQPITTPQVHQVRIEADQRLNAVIVRDLAERLPRYEQLVAALDVEPQSLEIEATIIDVNTDLARELGINWRWNNDGREAGYNGGVPTAGIGGIASIVLGSAGQFLARIRALQAEGAARVVSSPQVVTLSNVEAVFDTSSTFFVRVAGKDQVDLFNVSAGTSLRVTPHVFRDTEQTRIKLLVNVEDGNLTGRQVDQIPIVERSSINTQALIAEGQSLLIGGMVRDASSSSIDKVPVLGDVPVVGNLFKNRINSSSRIERMFLITPRLSNSRQAAPNASVRTAAVASGAIPATPPAPVSAPARRPSVVLDLDAMSAPPATRSIAPRKVEAAAGGLF